MSASKRWGLSTAVQPAAAVRAAAVGETTATPRRMPARRSPAVRKRGLRRRRLPRVNRGQLRPIRDLQVVPRKRYNIRSNISKRESSCLRRKKA